MAAGNTVSVVGNLTRDPELKFTNSGQALCSFGIAVNRRWQKDGQWEEQVSFFNVTAWGQMAENVSASLEKGSRVVVEGRLDQRSWETDSGDKRSVVEIVADEIAPSLRWATVEITKNERSEGQQGSGWGQGGGQRSSSKAPQQRQDSAMEEPF